MLSGMIERWAFARRFVPHDQGYLYRPSLTAPAYFVSAEEREQSLALFKKHRRWRTLKIVGIAIGALILVELAGYLINPAWLRTDPAWPGYIVGILMMGLLWRQLMQQNRIPLAIIGNREPVLPARGWLAAISGRMLARSWTVHLAVGIYLAGLCWLFYPRPAAIDRHPWYPWVYGLVAALLVTQRIWITWAKATRSADLAPA